MGRCLGLNCRGGCIGRLDASTGYWLIAISGLTSFPYFAALDHHIVRVALFLDLDLAKLNQSCFHISTFPWLEFQGKRQGF
jgi:hypothetical protein